MTKWADSSALITVIPYIESSLYLEQDAWSDLTTLSLAKSTHPLVTNNGMTFLKVGMATKELICA